MPRISVILPAFNAAAHLPRALVSIRSQTFADWELIVVDDGSTDATLTLLTSHAREEPRLRILSRRHEGIVAALNAGLAEARGPLVARMDADDDMHPERLEAQAALLSARPEIGLAGSLVEFGGDRSSALGYALHVQWMNEAIDSHQIAVQRFVESPFAHPSVMFRHDLVGRFGGYRAGAFPEDYELWLRWLEAGVQMAKVPKVLLTWNDLPDRLSRTDPRYHAEAFYRCKAYYLARWLKAHLNPERRLYVWGAGRLTRRRVDFLLAEGARLSGYIDVDPKKIGRQYATGPVIGPEQIPPPAKCFVLGYVGNRGARQLVRRELLARRFVEGENFLMAA